MLYLRAFIFLLLSGLLSLNGAMASERAQTSVQAFAAEQSQVLPANHHADSQTPDQLNCQDHCASQSLASNHCGVCLSALMTTMPLTLLTPASAIFVSSPTIVLQSIHFPPPLHPPLHVI